MNQAKVNQFYIIQSGAELTREKRAFNFYIACKQKTNTMPDDVKNAVDVN